MDATETYECLMSIGAQEKMFDALYRSLGASFDLPDCAMWVLYYLSSSKSELSQQELVEKMMFPKQTINSAVTGLTKKGLVKLVVISGTRNKKRIVLTDDGRELADKTVARLFKAECRAVEQMGPQRMAAFMELYHEFFLCLQEEFRKDGLIHGTRQ